jgi:hypothetical protein
MRCQAFDAKRRLMPRTDKELDLLTPRVIDDHLDQLGDFLSCQIP